MTIAPALFAGHGSPMNAIEDNAVTRAWAALAPRLGKPRAILAVSAHWVTDGVRVLSAPSPRTIHDFGGFPPALHAVRYEPPGDPALAEDLARRLAPFGARIDASWGLDHGTWSVLRWLFPAADVPTLQLSLDVRRTPAEHLALAESLAPLREDGVLVFASGNIVHNLRAFFRGDGRVRAEDTAFEGHIVDAVTNGDADAVAAYAAQPAAREAAPDWEHFVPILYAMGARREGETPELFTRELQAGIAMTGFAYGLG